jgi:hypothetical protein
MRTLSDGRSKLWPSPLAWFFAGVSWLACVGAFVVVRALVEWLV